MTKKEFVDTPTSEVEIDGEDKPVTLFTFTGKEVDIIKLKDEDIDIRDIAHSLSMQCRYNGMTKEYYSVAEHSVILAQFVLNNYVFAEQFKRNLARCILMHDAGEAYVGDMIYHLKQWLYEFDVIEEYVLEQIIRKFKIDGDFFKYRPIVTELDRAICKPEMEKLMFKVDPELDSSANMQIEIKCWTPKEAEEQFLLMFKELFPEFINEQ